MKGIQKEIEGMARLCKSAESELDEEAQQRLLEAFNKELGNLLDLEEEVVKFESPKSQKD